MYGIEKSNISWINTTDIRKSVEWKEGNRVLLSSAMEQFIEDGTNCDGIRRPMTTYSIREDVFCDSAQSLNFSCNIFSFNFRRCGMSLVIQDKRDYLRACHVDSSGRRGFDTATLGDRYTHRTRHIRRRPTLSFPALSTMMVAYFRCKRRRFWMGVVHSTPAGHMGWLVFLSAHSVLRPGLPNFECIWRSHNYLKLFTHAGSSRCVLLE